MNFECHPDFLPQFQIGQKAYYVFDRNQIREVIIEGYRAEIFNETGQPKIYITEYRLDKYISCDPEVSISLFVYGKYLYSDKNLAERMAKWLDIDIKYLLNSLQDYACGCCDSCDDLYYMLNDIVTNKGIIVRDLEIIKELFKNVYNHTYNGLVWEKRPNARVILEKLELL